MRSLLLVEDDEFVSASVVRALRPLFERIFVVRSVPAALKFLATDRVEVVLSDYDLGAGAQTGTELLDLIATAWPAIRRVLYSGTEGCRKPEAAHTFLSKPATVRDLVTVLAPWKKS